MRAAAFALSPGAGGEKYVYSAEGAILGFSLSARVQQRGRPRPSALGLGRYGRGRPHRQVLGNRLGAGNHGARSAESSRISPLKGTHGGHRRLRAAAAAAVALDPPNPPGIVRAHVQNTSSLAE